MEYEQLNLFVDELSANIEVLENTIGQINDAKSTIIKLEHFEDYENMMLNTASAVIETKLLKLMRKRECAKRLIADLKAGGGQICHTPMNAFCKPIEMTNNYKMMQLMKLFLIHYGIKPDYCEGQDEQLGVKWDYALRPFPDRPDKRYYVFRLRKVADANV